MTVNYLEVELGRYKLKVLGLDRILVSKRAANRMKDRLIIPVLEDSLAANRVAKRRSAVKSATKIRPSK